MNKDKLTAIAKAKNAKGDLFVVAHEIDVFGNDRGFGVWRLCSNYKLGRIVKTWRYVQRDMAREDAEKLLARRTQH